MIHIASHTIAKLLSILQTFWGWAVACVVFALDYFAGHWFIVLLAIAVTLMGAVWGVAVSIKQGSFTLSEFLRLTIAKPTGVRRCGCAN